MSATFCFSELLSCNVGGKASWLPNEELAKAHKPSCEVERAFHFPVRSGIQQNHQAISWSWIESTPLWPHASHCYVCQQGDYAKIKAGFTSEVQKYTDALAEKINAEKRGDIGKDVGKTVMCSQNAQLTRTRIIEQLCLILLMLQFQLPSWTLLQALHWRLLESQMWYVPAQLLHCNC